MSTARVLVLIPGLVAIGARLVTGPHPIDDAYITLRYAANLADGFGLVYNRGEWVLGTTSPLWALVLAAGQRVGLTDLPWLATTLSALFDAASCVLLTRLALAIGLHLPAAILVGLAWALNPMSIDFASGGMETSAFVLVLLVALALATRRKFQPLAAFVAGAGVALRPEAALLAMAVVIWSAVATRSMRNTVVVLAAAGAPILAAGATLFWFYGSPLPHSIAAKQVAYTPVGPLENPAALLVHAAMPGNSTFLLGAVPPVLAAVTVVFGLAGLLWLTWIGINTLSVRRLPWPPFAVFALLFVSFYVLVGLRGVRLFSWYAVPLQPLYLLGAASGLARVAPMRGMWLVGLLTLWQLPAIDWHAPFLPTGETRVREQLMLQVGRELGQTLTTQATIAAPEIGALGYASRLRMLDTVGLVSPSALPYYPIAPEQLVTDNAIPAPLIDAQRPDAVVGLDAYLEHTLLQDPTFTREYRLDQRLTAQVWHSQELLVFRRVTSE